VSLVLRARGGMSAIGQKNCLTLEDTDTGDQLMFDNGWSLAEADNGFGKAVNVGAFPDFEGVNPDRLCVVLTHGHDDHIRGVTQLARLWPNRPITVMGSTFTLRRLDWLLAKEGAQVTWEFLNWDETSWFPVFGNFQLRPLAVHHSILGACGVELNWYGSGGRRKWITHLGDFAPGDWRELHRFRKDPDYLLVDATGADKSGSTPHQAEAYQALQKLVRDADRRNGKRIIITGFSTTVERWHAVVDMACRQAKKMAVAGGSMKAMLEISAPFLTSEPGYTEQVLEANRWGADLLLITGSQAEEGSVLQQMAEGTYRDQSLRSGDVVVISASCIPSRHKEVGEMLRRIWQRIGPTGRIILDHRGWRARVDHQPVWATDRRLISPSGHATGDDIEQTVKMIKPQCVIPISAHRGNRVIVADAAERLGYRRRLVEDGEMVEL
jgi:ribonuclease J